MNADMLLDAFGLIDDRFLMEEHTHVIPWRRRFAVLIAAALIAAMCVGTAMAVSTEFREFVFSILRIDAPEEPPMADETQPTQPGLHEVDIVQIDGQVSAYYFTSGGFVSVLDGGFYTSAWPENYAAPAQPRFWEITFDGAKPVEAHRMDLSLDHGGKTFRIVFDHALVGGSLAVQAWPEGLDEDPVGNGWNVEPIPGSADAVLLTIPVLSGEYYTHDLFLLELDTGAVTALIADTIGRGVAADGFRLSADLRRCVITGIHPESGSGGHWLYDLDTGTMAELDTLTGRTAASPVFLSSDTLLFREYLPGGGFSILRWHIPSGGETVLLEHVTSDTYRPIRSHWADGHHGLIFGSDGSTLVDFETGQRTLLTGIPTRNLICDESPGSSRIMLGWEADDRITGLGILDTESGVLRLLERSGSGGPESFRGWLDENTLVVTAHDTPDFVPGDGYYVYVYRFTEPAQSPAVTEPADDAFVRVTDYIPDLAVDLRYATGNNFTGEAIYDFREPWLRYGTVKKLMQVQDTLRQQGLTLKLWDGFRPTSAQFRLWEICPDGRYVANPNTGFSSHSRGGTVDVTLAYTDGTELAMPTGFDDFSALADRDYSDCTPEAAANAAYLEELMEQAGFRPYQAEWWHFTDTRDYPVDTEFDPA